MSKYVVLTTRHRDMFFGGDVHLFWGPNRSGYTAVLQTAGVYSLEEAIQISDSDDVPIELEYLGVKEEDFGLTYDEVDVARVYRITKRSKAKIHRNAANFEEMKSIEK